VRSATSTSFISFFPLPQGNGTIIHHYPQSLWGRPSLDYSLCVHIATDDDALPVEVPPPPSRRKYRTRKGSAEWLADAEGMTDDETH
jgi:hypothetical protein